MSDRGLPRSSPSSPCGGRIAWLRGFSPLRRLGGLCLCAERADLCAEMTGRPDAPRRHSQRRCSKVIAMSCRRRSAAISTRTSGPTSPRSKCSNLACSAAKYLTDCRDEYPASWFARAKLSPSGRDCSLNCFGVHASQPLSEWRRKGWMHADDPRGRFQWYCRYYMGRRLPDEDARQIGRWKAIKRHVSQIRRHCEPGDPMCRPRQRQALLHWAYDSRTI
jgi:hypothetical protein